MPGLRMLLEFECDKYSWAEGYLWLTSSSPSFQNGIPAAQALAAARVPMLGNGASLQRIRMSQFPASRQVFDLANPFIPSTPTWPADPTGLTYSAGRAYSALLARWQSAEGAFRQSYLAGCPVGLIHTMAQNDTGLDWSHVGDFSSRAAALVQLLTNTSWGWFTRRDTQYQQAGPPVTNANFPGMIGVTVPNQIVLPPIGAQLILRNWRRLNVKLPPLAGIWSVGGVLPPTPPATGWTYFLYGSGAVPTNNYKAPGQMGLLFLDSRQIASVQWLEATERKRGATLGRPRGRSRSRI